MSLLLRNPHSVLAVLQNRPQDVLGITIPPKAMSEGSPLGSKDAWDKVVRLAEKHHVKVQTGAPQRSSKPVRGKASDESMRMSVAEASVKERQSLSIEELFANASTRAGGKGLWLALDSLQDTHNVGAIFRTAAFFGVQGILMTQDRSASLTATVYDVASGGLEHVPFTIQTNLNRALEVAKEAGLWILGSSEHAHDSYQSVQRDRPWLLVLGNEERGMRRLTEESCDVICKVSGQGQVHSLNVSVAAGVLIAHLSQ
jgi:23S rRNA (guanosine2251-2'-O)-methyltransferase